MFKFQEKKFKIVQKDFQELKIILTTKKRFLGKANGHNMINYMINIGGQRPKIGSN